ncbi:hypothetical protein BDV96DRAFT_630433 [Lophiotrema nucula]|uniref:Uncharacterized protein n=1 Tax=Lophiotrema nucula TaxID=690887 RepID=A0A6A5ZER9_9PLEO|nr:hypothetical protein BDV96DRAFT_630433 [Lophiotrema nucula]
MVPYTRVSTARFHSSVFQVGRDMKLDCFEPRRLSAVCNRKFRTSNSPLLTVHMVPSPLSLLYMRLDLATKFVIHGYHIANEVDLDSEPDHYPFNVYGSTFDEKQWHRSVRADLCASGSTTYFARSLQRERAKLKDLKIHITFKSNWVSRCKKVDGKFASILCDFSLLAELPKPLHRLTITMNREAPSTQISQQLQHLCMYAGTMLVGDSEGSISRGFKVRQYTTAQEDQFEPGLGVAKLHAPCTDASIRRNTGKGQHRRAKEETLAMASESLSKNNQILAITAHVEPNRCSQAPPAVTISTMLTLG